MKAPVIIFIEIALAGCVFLLYFLYKLWQDSRRSRPGPKVEIRNCRLVRAQMGKFCASTAPRNSAKEAPRGSRSCERISWRIMQDLMWVVITIAFFAVSIGYVEFCDRVK